MPEIRANGAVAGLVLVLAMPFIVGAILGRLITGTYAGAERWACYAFFMLLGALSLLIAMFRGF